LQNSETTKILRQFLCTGHINHQDIYGFWKCLPSCIDRAALVALLAILHERHVIAEPASPAGPIADELFRYDTHMRDARGLADGTRRGRLRIIERLLLSKFAGRSVIIGELRSENIRDFIAEQLKSLSTTSNAITIASALRAYLRYRASCGDAVQPLLAVISSPAHWSLASLPRSLKPEEVERLLSSFTAALPSPHRGYAVVRIALDLGLRSIEISQLQLDDIDWRLGTVTLKLCTTRFIAQTFCFMHGTSAAPTKVHRAWMGRTLRTSRSTEC